MSDRTIAIVGGGPAGLTAAEAAIRSAGADLRVDVYDAMPSLGRKFLLAGKGGLNLTHAEPRDAFLSRYGPRRDRLAPLLDAFGPDDVRTWVHGFGIETFVGSSGRAFPTGMKAAPLLRAWLHRLRAGGLRVHVRHRWRGWNGEGGLRFETPDGERIVHADAVVLAPGGGSWPQLGSDGAWIPHLAGRGVQISALRPSNCGFDVGWSEHFRGRFAGAPVKTVVASFTDPTGTSLPFKGARWGFEVHVPSRRAPSPMQRDGPEARVGMSTSSEPHPHPTLPPEGEGASSSVRAKIQGEFIVTETGVEGGLIYALSPHLRDRIAAAGTAVVHLDLAPDWELVRLAAELSRPRASRSLSSHIQSRIGLKGVKVGLLREIVPAPDFVDPGKLAAAIKALPLTLVAPRPLAEAISSAGGVAFEALDERLMLRALPGVFCAGEMLDWEAPTGGYLLTACFATGRAAGAGATRWAQDNPPPRR